MKGRGPATRSAQQIAGHHSHADRNHAAMLRINAAVEAVGDGVRVKIAQRQPNCGGSQSLPVVRITGADPVAE
jgi:hypothetical protein